MYEVATQQSGEMVSRNTQTEMMISRQAQEVQGAMVIAKRFPRDEVESFNRIMQSCKRKSLAESAMYEYPRGGTKVSGPSIRLAEAMAQNWGNIDFGITELEQKNGESQVMAYAWDLETNTRQVKIFSVPHVRGTKKGNVPLTDPRDVYEMVANQGARRLRSCILGIIPGDVVEAAVKQCEDTLINGEKRRIDPADQSGDGGGGEKHRGSEYRGEDSSEDYRDNHHEAERTEGFYYDQHHNEVCAGTDAWSCDCSRHPEGSEERRD